MKSILVADIGGTNARFGLAEKRQDGTFSITAQYTLKCSEFNDPVDLINTYLKHLNLSNDLHYACLAIAGPVDDNVIAMTNHQWRCSGDEICRQLGFTIVKVVNDWAAMAYAAPFFAKGDLHTLYEATPNPNGVVALMGPGTGFGASALKPTDHGYEILATEGGHVAFAPGNQQELQLLELLMRKKSHVSVEDLLSGTGLVTIYNAMATLTGKKPELTSPSEISTHGLKHTDPICVDTLTLFCNVLGSVAGDKALDFYASGGVFIGGGIAPRLENFLPQTDFLSRFRNKGLMNHFVEQIPIYLIKTDNAALIGCAAWLDSVS